MSENDNHDETQPVRRDGATTPPPAPESIPTAPPVAEQAPAAAAPVHAPVARRGFRDRFRSLRSSDGNRTFGLAALIASALAGVIVGGLGVTAVQAVATDHHDRDGWMQQRGPTGRDGDDFGDRGPMHGGPPGVPGQVQPTTPPEDEGSAS